GLCGSAKSQCHRARAESCAPSGGVRMRPTVKGGAKTACPWVSLAYCEEVTVFFIADIVGQPGRRAVKDLVPRLRLEHTVNLTIANGENAAGGSGISVKTAEEIFSAGVDIITSGDHLWDQREVLQ